MTNDEQNDDRCTTARLLERAEALLRIGSTATIGELSATLRELIEHQNRLAKACER